MTLAPSTADLESTRIKIDELRDQVARTYIGNPAAIDLLMIAMLARGHCLLEGVPGVAKTTLVKAFARALGCSVRRIQFTPDLLPADITGTYVLNPKENSFTLRAGPIFANVVLADEINRAPAKTQSALLEAMQERQVTIEGDRFELPNPFLVLATQNPIDQEGTYPLPESQIDRFLISAELGYPSHQDEVTMLRTHGWASGAGDAVTEAAPVLSAEEALKMQAVASGVHVEDDLLDYTVRLTHFTRHHPKVTLGASPRSSLALLCAAKAHAVLSGRGYATPDDIQKVVVAVLGHRLILIPELEGDPQARVHVVKEALAKVGYQRPLRAV